VFIVSGRRYALELQFTFHRELKSRIALRFSEVVHGFQHKIVEIPNLGFEAFDEVLAFTKRRSDLNTKSLISFKLFFSRVELNSMISIFYWLGGFCVGLAANSSSTPGKSST
jgi:hypothetical protein